MAVPPSVPTSFVPRPGSTMVGRGGFDFGGAAAFVGYAAFALALLMAGGMFAYEWYLSNTEIAKKAELQKAIESIDTATVDTYLRLSDRLVESKRLINSHLILSGLFSPIETLLPTSVRLTSLAVSAPDGHATELSASGVASSFNALAAFSASLGNGKGIKDAVFSNISIERGGSITFALAASINSSLVAFTADTFAPVAPPPPQEPATTTPATP